MASDSQRPELSVAVAAALTELEAVARYRHAQRRAASEERGDARPLEFDANGFPLAQPATDSVRRVKRLFGDA